MKVKYIIVCAVIILTGCNRLSPAGFWKDFDSKLIKEQKSEQGPWGGHRFIYWENTSEAFNVDYIIKYAQTNGWRLLGSKAVNTTNLIGRIQGNGTLYIFDSGWVVIVNDKSQTAYGYIFLRADNKQMALYHRWGE